MCSEGDCLEPDEPLHFCKLRVASEAKLWRVILEKQRSTMKIIKADNFDKTKPPLGMHGLLAEVNDVKCKVDIKDEHSPNVEEDEPMLEAFVYEDAGDASAKELDEECVLAGEKR